MKPNVHGRMKFEHKFEMLNAIFATLPPCNLIEQHQIFYKYIHKIIYEICILMILLPHHHVIDLMDTGYDHRILNISDIYVKISINSRVSCIIISIWTTHIINQIHLICTRYMDYLANTCRTLSSPLTFPIIG